MTKSRIAEERVTEEQSWPQWRPQGNIPDPDPMPGWVLGWKRQSMRGAPDAANWAAALREGWQPVHPSEQPSLKAMTTMPGQATLDYIEVGGLVLCKMPAEMARQRDQYYANKNRDVENSLDRELKKEFASDSRVRLINDRQSDTRYL